MIASCFVKPRPLEVFVLRVNNTCGHISNYKVCVHVL